MSIIIDELRSPVAIPMVHYHEFHVGREITHDDWGGTSSYWPQLITQVERVLRLIMHGVLVCVLTRLSDSLCWMV